MQLYSKLQFMVILIYHSFANCDVLYHISSTQDSCTRPRCLTISQLASNHTFNSNTTLNFLSGNHSLFSGLLVANIGKLKFTSEANTNIICQSPANVMLINISHLYISGIDFYGCSENTLQSVSHFTIQDSSFHGQRCKASALNLSESSGSILRTLFVSNQHGTLKNSVSALSNDYGRVGGAAVITQSNIMIVNCTFEENTAEVGGAIYGEQHSNITITTSQFVKNSVSCSDNERECFGGVLSTENRTNLIIQKSSFHSNKALGLYGSGGVLIALGGTITIKESNFTDNSAGDLGGVCIAVQSSLVIDDTDFLYNRAENVGGTIHLASSSATIKGGKFESSTAHSRGGSIYAVASGIKISGTTVLDSYAHEDGGAIYFDSVIQTSLIVYKSKFYRNSAGYGGVLSMRGLNAQLHIRQSEFVNNTGKQNGGVAYIEQATLVTITSGYFINSVAYRHGGVLYAFNVSLLLQDCHFIHGKAYQTGSVLYVTASDVKTNGTILISNNTARLGVIYLLQSAAIFTDILNFSNNLGSIVAHNSVINFAGNITVINSSSIRMNMAQSLFEGGAITAFQSVLNFTGKIITLTLNQADIGGAVYASESKLYIFSELVVISKNKANYNGGGIFLYLGELNCQPNSNLNISDNIASQRGGGIHAVSSMLKAYVSYTDCLTLCDGYSGATIYFTGNQAKLGGGACLDANSKLYILKKEWSLHIYLTLHFTSNSASYGGALFVSDETNSGVCASTSYQMSSVITECFIQSIAQYSFASLTNINFVSMKFVRNQAHFSGANLYGGLLDRCTVSPFAEVYSQRDELYHPYQHHSIITGVDYFTNITKIKNMTSISSYPVRICFCTNGQPNCGYTSPVLLLMKGERFVISLVAVDQVNNTFSSANIKVSLKSYHSGLGEGQLIQMTLSNKSCTELHFNLFSPHDHEELTLYPEGPCKDAALSQRRVKVQFLPCHCPVGLQHKLIETSNCLCECDSRLLHYISYCNSTTGMILREGTFWITFINTTDNNLNSTVGDFLIHPYCPFDYCKPSDSKIEINLNLENGADAQCAHDRMGTLCGTCQHGLSLSIGSSHCLHCHSNWPVTLSATLIGSAIAGVLLIAISLILNMTVAVGTLNGIIFYANIVAAYRSTFFPVSETNVITVFIAWINLEVGVDFCLFEGMDAYHKTWLQMAFPVYVILLVVVVILISEHSTKLARLIGRKNPVAVLATLVLLSYAKLLSIIIAALSFTVLEYPDGSREVVWLSDASVFYLRGKHIALFIASLVILVCGVAYTTLLFTWQWLLRYQNRKILGWISGNLKISLFIEPYLAPYTFKHRYWTGLVLFTRVVLNIITSVNTSSDPGINLLAIGTVMTLLLLLRSCLSGNIYKKKLVEILELICILNIIILCFATFFVNGSSLSNQNVTGYISGSITLLLFLIVGVHHILFEFCLKIQSLKRLVNLTRPRRNIRCGSETVDGEALMSLNEYSDEAECSVSFVDAPPRDEQPLSSLLEDCDKIEQ